MTKKLTKSQDDHDVLAEKERIFNNPSPYRTLGGGLSSEEIGNIKPALPTRPLTNIRSTQPAANKEEATSTTTGDSSLSGLDDDINQIISDRIDHSEAFDMPPSLLPQETSIRDEKYLLANRLNNLPSSNDQPAKTSATSPSSSTLRRHGSFGTTAPPKPGAPKNEDSFNEGMDKKMPHDDGIDLKTSLHHDMPRNNENEKSPSTANENRNAKMFAIAGRTSSLAPSNDTDEYSTVPGMVPLVRQRVTAIPTNSQLLTPTNPMIKVRPEAGEQMPGAYAAAGIAFNETPTSANDDEDSEVFQDEGVEPNQTTPDVIALTLMQSLGNSEAEGPVPYPPHLTMDVSGGTMLTAETVPADQNSQEIASPKHRKFPYGVCPTWVVIVLITCLTIGIVVTAVVMSPKGQNGSSNLVTLAPTPIPFSCSFQTMILDFCSANENLFSGVPECVLDRYRELLEVFKPSLQQRGLDTDKITCNNINHLAFLSLAFNTKSNDIQFLSDWFSLTVLYLSTECYMNRAMPSWLLEGSDPCNGWLGVKCETNSPSANISRVTSLVLSGQKLAGTLPPNLQQLFPNLKALLVQYNGIQGTLSHDYSKLEFLLLQGNKLSGQFPSFLMQSTNLKLLELRNNEFQAAGTSMQDLPFTGTQWEYIDLAGTDFTTGPLPSKLFKLTKLVALNLQNTGLSGPIPTEIGLLSNLKSLILPANSLTGPIPSELGSLANLGVPFDDVFF
mmetsp:Transcript_17549/g.26588  ORF Transcript_17549/g.26588 Transcript_17549/m.26588 type:complete len:727 (+) Transcript_17549:92-2272(+)